MRSVASWNVAYLLAYAEAHGLDPRALMDRFEIDPEALDDVDGRVALSCYVRMWHELPTLVGDPDMPLHVLQHASAADPPLSVLIFLIAFLLGFSDQAAFTRAFKRWMACAPSEYRRRVRSEA